MPDALFEMIRKLETSPLPENPVELSSLQPEREPCRQAFVSQRKEPYVFLSGQTTVYLFFDAQGAPLDALLHGYLQSLPSSGDTGVSYP